MMNIDKLASTPPPRIPVREKVLPHLDQIEKARRMGWGWTAITKSLDLPANRWRAVWRLCERHWSGGHSDE